MSEEGTGGEGGVLPTAKQRAARAIKELWINGKPCEDRVAWSRELKQHCDKSSNDERDTLLTQRGRMVRNWERGVEQERKGGGDGGKQPLTSCYDWGKEARRMVRETVLFRKSSF